MADTENTQVIRIPAHYKPRPEQIDFWKAYHSGIRFFDLCWHRREGKDLTALNATVEEILTKRPGLAWHMFPTLAQGRKVLWDATDNEGRPITSAFPKPLITEINKADMRIKCKFVPDIAAGKTEVRESTWQVVGADNPDSLRGGNPILVVISEFGDIAPNVWYEIIQPILLANNGKAMFVWTPKGRNHAYTLHQAAMKSMYNPDEPKEFKWFAQVLTADDTTKWVDEQGVEVGIPTPAEIKTGKYRRVPVITQEAIEESRKQGMDESKILQEYYCHPPETLVTTALGQVRIDSIKAGDCVLTHTGKLQPVKEVLCRDYTGELVELVYYGNNVPLLCTPDHPIRVHNPSNQTYTWKAAGTLKKGDLVCFPKRLHSAGIADKNLVILLAWYLSDGSLTHNAVEITTGAAEKKNLQELCTAIEALGYTPKVFDDKGSNTKKIFVYSASLREVIATACRVGSANKRIPFELIGSHEELFLKTLLKGDGYKVDAQRYSYSTISPHLAYGVQQLAVMLGYRAGVGKYKTKEGNIQGRTIHSSSSIWCVRINFSKTFAPYDSEKIKFRKYCMTGKVRSVKRIPYTGKVYNMSVLADESFTANGISSHNCSFDAALKGAYFGEQMNDAAREGRISSDVKHRPDMPVITAWDLGMDDTMEVIFAQCIEDSINIIDYYSNNGKTLDHYIKEVLQKPYTYSFHFGPHDLNVRELGAGSRLEHARKLGIAFRVIPRVSHKEDSINAARAILPRCRFNIDRCAKLIEALKSYTKKWDEKRQCYSDTPLHNWCSNSADAFQCLAMGLFNHPTAMKRIKLTRTEDMEYRLFKPDMSKADDYYDIFNYRGG